MTTEHRNRLAIEPSLYLRQHAGNPVDWYAWGSEALERARAENKPILLSIGYSACHWCHVMAHESFENERIAQVMNKLFVCVKVDREERPDLDNLYMKSVQMMTGHGGWPMTVFLTPDLRPFYAGTYFPPEDRGGMPGFPRVLVGVERAYREQGEQVAERGAQVVERLEELSRSRLGESSASREGLTAAADSLCDVMDADHGGFGDAPKFPGSLSLSFLMGVERETPNERRRALVKTALDRMADGGIYDHLGGGFHRYSVDRYWLVPHFEKMLYDQALLVDLYTEAWRLFRDARYRAVSLGILDYVAREMTSEGGGFYATQDADSEGEEGKYFVWTSAEVADVVGSEDADLVCRFFDVTESGNFEGANILHRGLDYADAAKLFDRTTEDVERTIARASAALLERRMQRVAPATDKKILADWNGLMIGAMASAGRLFGRDDLVDRASRAADFVRERMMDGERLHHFHAEGASRVGAFLDDYAFFGRGCLELFHAAGRREDLETARACARALIESFSDEDLGGFYFTRAGDEAVIVRSRDLYDGAVPAGNSVATELLLRLYQLTAEDELRVAGERALEAFAGSGLRNPHGAAHLLAVTHRRLRGYTTVVVVGKGELGHAALELHCPEMSVLATSGDGEEWVPDAVRGKTARDGAETAYVCRGQACSPPAGGVQDLLDLIK